MANIRQKFGTTKKNVTFFKCCQFIIGKTYGEGII